MPPFCAAAEMLASPIATRTIPQASALPTLGPVMAGPAATGPFALMVTGAMTGPWPRAQPVINAAHDTASTRLFNMDIPPSLLSDPLRSLGYDGSLDCETYSLPTRVVRRTAAGRTPSLV